MSLYLTIFCSQEKLATINNISKKHFQGFPVKLKLIDSGVAPIQDRSFQQIALKLPYGFLFLSNKHLNKIYKFLKDLIDHSIKTSYDNKFVLRIDFSPIKSLPVNSRTLLLLHIASDEDCLANLMKFINYGIFTDESASIRSFRTLQSYIEEPSPDVTILKKYTEDFYLKGDLLTTGEVKIKVAPNDDDGYLSETGVSKIQNIFKSLKFMLKSFNDSQTVEEFGNLYKNEIVH
jgi:hypothetical protein